MWRTITAKPSVSYPTEEESDKFKPTTETYRDILMQ